MHDRELPRALVSGCLVGGQCKGSQVDPCRFEDRQIYQGFPKVSPQPMSMFDSDSMKIEGLRGPALLAFYRNHHCNGQGRHKEPVTLGSAKLKNLLRRAMGSRHTLKLIENCWRFTGVPWSPGLVCVALDW